MRRIAFTGEETELFKRPHRLRICLAAVLISFVSARSAGAFELFGRCIIGPCQSEAEQDAIRFIDPLRYEANIVVSGADEVADAVRSASQTFAGRNEAVGGSAALISRAQGDYRRLLAAMYAQGYYAGEISIRIDGQEADQLSVGTQLSDEPRIDITVDPGPSFRFGVAEITNTPRDWGAPDDFRANEIARSTAVRSAARAAIDGWRNDGHALAKINDESIKARHAENLLDVRLGIDPGPPTYLSVLSVEGTQNVDPDFVARMTGLSAGDVYSPEDLRRAVKRMERLGVFSVQKLEEGKALDENGQLPVTLIVEERKPRRIGVGATLSNVEGLGAEAFWLHRNLFGRAERLRVDASIGGVGNTFDYRDFTYEVRTTFEKPGVFTIDTTLQAEAYGLRETNETFVQTSAGASIGFSHIFNDRITFGGSLYGEYGRFERDGSDNARTFGILGIKATGEFDGRDAPLDATEGFFASAEITAFHELNFANTGARIDGEVRYYQRLLRSDRVVLAGRIKAGSIVGLPVDETPDNLLFHAGGGGSVRGYGFRNIAVTEADGTQRGGQSRIEASLEARVRFGERFGGVIFADAGSVSDGAGFDDVTDWRVSVGAGVRYYTPLGPLRLDVALPLNGREGDPTVGIYAGIGQAF